MKTLLKILLFLLPALSVAQYHDAQWIFDDYKFDFRKSNDSILIHTGKNMQQYMFEYEYMVNGISFNYSELSLLQMLDFCHSDGNIFLHINNDSTWINKNLKRITILK